MARRSLRPQLNQIRAWVRQGRTDAWIAHQLEVTVQEIQQFKRQNELDGEEEAGAVTGADFPDEIDLRAEDDALIAAELEAAALEAERERAEAEAAARARAEEVERERAERAERREDAEEDEGEGEEAPRPRRRGRRGGRGRRSTPRTSMPLEGTFEHGEEGYGLWLDPAIQDNPVYAEHWAGHRPVQILVEEDQIVIRRAGSDD
jgi:septal ring factor EnvC (AmiA/AmiB activator)